MKTKTPQTKSTPPVALDRLVRHLIYGDIEEASLAILGEDCPTYEEYNALDVEQQTRLAAAATVAECLASVTYSVSQIMSDTPKTETETWRDEMDHVDTDYTFAQSATVSADFARQLERLLNDAKETIDMMETRHGATMLCHQAQMDEVTKQRDALAEALEHMLTHGETHQPPLRDTISNIAFQALAAVKGGQYE
jgi:hypothetical protein